MTTPRGDVVQPRGGEQHRGEAGDEDDHACTGGEVRDAVAGDGEVEGAAQGDAVNVLGAAGVVTRELGVRTPGAERVALDGFRLRTRRFSVLHQHAGNAGVCAGGDLLKLELGGDVRLGGLRLHDEEQATGYQA
ncbi:MAG: hypothetical protein EXR49_05515 [Dehalococcoidia bacterium]|nr:hypothetical protein [Dehalococcoidia bacterium]